ncbi:MAG: hypothetical protein RLZZ450_5737 [Pseudomonadota bacterium]|jgi:hypothetical protein
MNRDLRDYEDITQFVRAVEANREELRALDESALSGDQHQLAMVRDAFSLLRESGLPTS